MKLKIYVFSLLPLLATISACGGSGGRNGSEASDKNLAITVTGSRSFNAEIDHGRIDHYLVSITADDMADPVEDVVGGDAEGTTLYGVPAGSGRQLTILAYNENGVIIRRAVKEGITVYNGEISRVTAAMKSVPVFTTITDGSAVSGNRLEFGIFGEPDSSLMVMQVDGEEETKMIDASSNVAYVDSSPEDGLFSFDPGTLDYGTYTFKLEDTETHESITVTVSLYQSLTRPGASFSFGGQVYQLHSEVVVQNMDAMGRMANVEDDNAGNVGILDVADIFLE